MAKPSRFRLAWRRRKRVAWPWAEWHKISPAGLTEISRWWSEERAEPPDSRPSENWRAGGAREPFVQGFGGRFSRTSGARDALHILTGGSAPSSLHHRLISLGPPARQFNDHPSHLSAIQPTAIAFRPLRGGLSSWFRLRRVRIKTSVLRAALLHYSASRVQSVMIKKSPKALTTCTATVQ